MYQSKFSKLSLEKVIFLFFISVYAVVFLINPKLGPSDDVVFLRTLQINKPLLYYSPDFPYFNTIELGRFSPLVAIEYNFVSLFSNNPFWYFFYHAVQFIIFAFLLVNILKYATDNKVLIYLTPILVFLLPGFTDNWFRLQQGDRNVIFFSAVLILAYFNYLNQPRTIYFLLGVLSANLAIYYKETSFIIIGAFALANLIFQWREYDKKLKIFNFALIFSSSLYLVLYYFYVIGSNSNLLYLDKSFNPLLVIIKNFFNYAFFSDPILILIAVPLTIQRLYKLLTKKSDFLVYDALLVGGAAYIFTYLFLNLYSPYYLLPAYIFCLPSLIFFLAKKTFSSFFWKIVLMINIFLLVFNVIPAGIHFLTGKKYFTVNFDKTLDFLIEDIRTRHSDKKANIFLDKTDLFSRKDVHFIFVEFLLFKGLSEEEFDMKSSEKASYYAPDFYKIKHPFSAFTKDTPSKISKGDYLIVSPYTANNIDKRYIQLLEKDYNLIFYTQSRLAFPAINLKTLIKYFLMKNLSNKSKGIIVNENLMQWPDFYVFIKK